MRVLRRAVVGARSAERRRGVRCAFRGTQDGCSTPGGAGGRCAFRGTRTRCARSGRFGSNRVPRNARRRLPRPFPSPCARSWFPRAFSAAARASWSRAPPVARGSVFSAREPDARAGGRRAARSIVGKCDVEVVRRVLAPVRSSWGPWRCGPGDHRPDARGPAGSRGTAACGARVPRNAVRPLPRVFPAPACPRQHAGTHSVRRTRLRAREAIQCAGVDSVRGGRLRAREPARCMGADSVRGGRRGARGSGAPVVGPRKPVSRGVAARVGGGGEARRAVRKEISEPL